MLQNSKTKICILVDSLSEGGAERAAAKLSVDLHQKGMQVSVVYLRDQEVYKTGGIVYNLGKNESSIKPVKQFQKLHRMRKVIRSINPDVIVDFRMRNRWMMEFLLFHLAFKKYRVIYRINSSKIDWHIPNGSYFHQIYQKSSVVAVAMSIKDTLELKLKYERVTYIPNYITEPTIKNQELGVFENESFIIAVGRLANDIKQFDKLIAAYANSELPSKGVKLLILGDGPDKFVLNACIQELQMEANVNLLGFVTNIHAYMRKAKFLVLCSALEGFPNVLVESLIVQTPVISFDCNSGPSEIIHDEENGLLIEDQNFEALTAGMNRLLADEVLYKHCKANTQTYIAKFSKEKVVEKWLDLLK